MRELRAIPALDRASTGRRRPAVRHGISAGANGVVFALVLCAMPLVIRWSAMVFVLALAGAQVVRPARTNPPAPASASLTAEAPPAVSAILERSCRDCHSNETRWPWYSNVAPMSWMLISHVNDGRDAFNYSEWKTYNADDQDKLLGSICSLTKRGRMPLPSYLMIHRDAKLSQAEITTLCTWSEKMRDTLQ